MTAVKEMLLEFNLKLNGLLIGLRRSIWRVAKNVKDWAISRERYWGTPLPVWVCTECNHQHCIGSTEEMASMPKKEVQKIGFAQAVCRRHRACLSKVFRRYKESHSLWIVGLILVVHPSHNGTILSVRRKYPRIISQLTTYVKE